MSERFKGPMESLAEELYGSHDPKDHVVADHIMLRLKERGADLWTRPATTSPLEFHLNLETLRAYQLPPFIEQLMEGTDREAYVFSFGNWGEQLQRVLALSDVPLSELLAVYARNETQSPLDIMTSDKEPRNLIGLGIHPPKFFISDGEINGTQPNDYSHLDIEKHSYIAWLSQKEKKENVAVSYTTHIQTALKADQVRTLARQAGLPTSRFTVERAH
jgi:hypothetical protein